MPCGQAALRVSSVASSSSYDFLLFMLFDVTNYSVEKTQRQKVQSAISAIGNKFPIPFSISVIAAIRSIVAMLPLVIGRNSSII